jgi:hypothetical protein
MAGQSRKGGAKDGKVNTCTSSHQVYPVLLNGFSFFPATPQTGAIGRPPYSRHAS